MIRLLLFPRRLCSVEGCGKPYLAKGLCSAHWQRQKRHGDTETVGRRWDGHTVRRRSRGYVLIERDGAVVLEHVAIAERALGKSLPPEAIVHHVNETKDDNRPGNLVICPNAAYHALIHHRMKLQALGLPLDWMKCEDCKRYDSPANLYCASTRDGRIHSRYHSKCRVDKRRAQRAQRRVA